MEHEELFRQYMKYARTRLMSSEPFFGSLIAQCNVRLREGQGSPQETAYTNGRDVFFFNTLLPRISKEEFTGILLHEVLHVAYLHVPRAKSALVNPTLWNYATDYVINLQIRDSIAEMEKRSSGHRGVDLPEWVLYDEQFRDMSSEAVYQQLMKDMPPEALKQLEQGMAGGQGSEAGNEDRSFSPEELAEFLPGFAEGKDAMAGDIQPEKKGQAADALGPDEMAKAGQEAKRALAQAAQTAKMQGRMPAHLERMIDGILHPKADWRKLLKDFVQAFPVDYSFVNLDRRFNDWEFVIPGLNGEQVELTVAVDTSGSFSPEQLKEALSEVHSMVSSFDYITLTIISCDAAVQSVETVHSASDIANVKLKGGGGTDFRPVFDWIRENQPSCKGLVYFTDGYGSFPEPDEAGSWKTLWVINSEMSLDDVPFGHAIEY